MKPDAENPIPESQELSLNLEAPKPNITKRRALPDKISGHFQRNSEFKYVPTDGIFVDPAYQRRLRIKKIIKMAHNWDPNKTGVLVVNKRIDGRYYVIDGQHRHAALQLMENYPTHLLCEVFAGLTPEQEARYFHDLDNERDNLTPGASFRALLAAKDATALGIERAAQAAGLTIEYGVNANGNLRAFKTVQDIYRRYGEDGLIRVLRTAKSAWPNRIDAVSEPILRGLELLFTKFPAIDETRLNRTLSATTPPIIVGGARRLQEDLSSNIYGSVGQTIRGLYNKGLRHKLEAW